MIVEEIQNGSYTYQKTGATPEEWSYTWVPFIDMDLPYDTPGLDKHLPVDNAEAIFYQLLWYPPQDVVSAQRTEHDFLQCEGTTTNQTLFDLFPVWSSPPGWSRDAATTQRGSAFHLPVIHVEVIAPLDGLQARNAAGVWTMCTADFDAWFAAIVPPPQVQ